MQVADSKEVTLQASNVVHITVSTFSAGNLPAVAVQLAIPDATTQAVPLMHGDAAAAAAQDASAIAGGQQKVWNAPQKC